MITFRKKTLSQDLMPQAIEHLTKEGVPFKLIAPEQADAASKLNSRSMVLMSFIKNESGFFQITVKDKEFYNYTRKFLTDPEFCRMRLIDESKKDRTFTVETDHLGIVLDVIEVLGIKYNLSIVEE